MGAGDGGLTSGASGRRDGFYRSGGRLPRGHRPLRKKHSLSGRGAVVREALAQLLGVDITRQ